MGRRSSTKKTPVRNASVNNGDDVLLKDMLLEDQNQIITVHQNGVGAAETISELTDVAILEDDNPKTQLTEVAVIELDRSMEVVKSTRKSMRLLGAPADDLGTPSGSGTVEVALEGALKEQDSSQSLQVKKTDSGELERLFKIVQEQQLRIDELAAEKSLARKDETSLAEIEHKGKSKYKTKYEDAQKKIQGLEQNQNELTLKCENANSKLEGYIMGQQNIGEIIDKLRDAAYFQSLSVGLPSTTSKISRTPKHPVHAKGQPTAPKTRKRKVIDIGKPPSAPKTRVAAKKKRV